MSTAHRFHTIEVDGPWTSPPFPPAERRHIVQEVIGGFIMGRPRWATDLDGTFIYGLDAKGKEMMAEPAYTPKPVPRRRGKNKPKVAMSRKKTAAQLDREIAEALVARSGAENPFEDAKAELALIEKEMAAAEAVMHAFPRGAMGLPPESVRLSPEYRTAKARTAKAFARLREFNAVFTKRFAKELRAERAKRYGSR
jgi:hypothetical protein